MLIREWAAAKYPAYRLWEQVRLGPTQAYLVGQPVSAALEAMLRVSNWYADGIITTDAAILVVESKMQPNPSAVGQVLFYAREVMRTPQYTGSLNLSIQPVVLFAEADDDVTNFARQLGCRVETYTPAWIGDYLTQVQFRYRAPAPPSTPAEPS